MAIQILEGLSEREYRLLPYDSYSSIKEFITSYIRYYKKFILKERIDETKEQEKDDMRFGNIVDCLKFTPDDFDSRYQIATSTKPSSQMLDFVEEMYRLCVKNTNEHGVLCGSIDRMIEDSYAYLQKESKTGKLRDSLDKFKERFLDKKEGYEYFLELKDRGTRIIITSEELEWANGLVDYMNNHPHTASVMGLETNDKRKVVDQLMLTGEVNGDTIKIMEDRVVFNFEKKIITPFDLKVMSNNRMFPYNYIKLKYYIQNAVCTTLLRQNYPDWVVRPLTFVTIDKYRQNDPVNVYTTEKQYLDAMNGFVIDGRRYPGLLDSVKDMKWHKEMDIWTTTREIYEGNNPYGRGFLELQLNNQVEE